MAARRLFGRLSSNLTTVFWKCPRSTAVWNSRYLTIGKKSDELPVTTPQLDDNSTKTFAQRVQRAKHRCGQRGLKELDLALGGWSKSAEFHELMKTEVALEQLEVLLCEEVPDLMEWLLQKDVAVLPEKYRNDDHLIHSIRKFVHNGQVWDHIRRVIA